MGATGSEMGEESLKVGEVSPLVSVLIPSFNHAPYIKQCVLSILDQTYKNFELIVIDDGSTDGTREILRELNATGRFTLVEQDNRGCAAVLNRGISQLSKGSLIGVCASDDFWHPKKIERMVEFMMTHPAIPMCYSKSVFVNEKSEVLERETRSANRLLRGGWIFKELLLQRIHLLPGLIRRTLFEEVGLYREGVWTEDLYMNLRIAYRHEIGFLDEHLNFYRFPTNFSGKIRTARVPLAHLECMREYASSEHYPEAMREWHFRNLVWFSGNRREKALGIKALWGCKSLAMRPRYWVAFLKIVFVWK